MGLPKLYITTVVGSFPRPEWLWSARERFEKGEVGEEKFKEYLEDAVKLTIKEQEIAGVDVVSDGEQRRFSFFNAELFRGMTYKPIYELAHKRESIEYLRSIGMPEGVRHPVTVGELELNRDFLVEEASSAVRYSSKPVKVALPSPYLLMIDSWNERLSRDYYSRPEDLGFAVARLINEAIRLLRDLGVFFVQLDDPGLTDPIDPTYYKLIEMINGYRPREPLDEELNLARDLINEALKGVSGVKLGVHVCRGNWPGPEDRMPRGGYDRIMPWLMDLKAEQLVLEFATPRAGSIDVLKDYRPDKEIGLGVIDVKKHTIESVDTVVERVKKASRYLDPGRIWLNPDCGFASGATWPVQPRRRSFEKLKPMVEAAKRLRREYGEEQ